ncbi:hypothetical protein H5410_005429 [Solanum commersonii]|uniref:Uncharacterized protein n=1 Tax=Solanum commersonii TaxID=4109 RepID=A0A9J6A7E6_SOLCO|nr:hypothetical protein H5410_005429 [Solanum commersonii]
MESVGPKGQIGVFSIHGFLVIQNSGLFLAKIFHGRLLRFINGVSWSRMENRRIFKFKRALKQEKLDFSNFYLVPRGKRECFQDQMSRKVGKSRFCQFSLAIVKGFLVIRNSRFFWLKIFIDVH